MEKPQISFQVVYEGEMTQAAVDAVAEMIFTWWLRERMILDEGGLDRPAAVQTGNLAEPQFLGKRDPIKSTNGGLPEHQA
jgi:hypothetical protein